MFVKKYQHGKNSVFNKSEQNIIKGLGLTWR